MPMIKIRDWRCIEKCKTMKICQDVGDIFILRVDGPNSIHAELPAVPSRH